ncbi:MAG: hypothetical protein ACRD2A_02345 [Vicinamibacterales bacterium]
MALVGMLVCWHAPSAFAQSDRRIYFHGDFGYGAMEDDEGTLGKGLALGAAIGGVIVDAVQVEFSVTRMHHQRSLAISWEGDITSYVGRVAYRSGGPGSTTRFIAGIGAGHYSYSGIISETIFPALSAAPIVDRFHYSFSGFVYETGLGLEFEAGRNAFIRPEVWVTLPSGERTTGGRTPEPPFLIARAAVVAGLRF